MAVPGTIQALIAAFSFGILFNASSAALVLHIKGHGSEIYRDGLRLALILFLLTSSSWALVEFLATLIEPSATTICQVAVTVSSLFDQVGRVAVEQYLVWAVPKGETTTIFSFVPQILVFGRLFVGIAFTAVARTQFKPTCAPVTSIQAVSLTTIGLDAVIIGLLSIQAFSGGITKKISGSPSTTLKIKTVRIVTVGVAVWWGTSVTSLLGLESIDLFYKTALPGIGLTILVGLITVLFQSLAIPRELPQRPDSPLSRGVRDLSSSDSTDYPPSRYEDLKDHNAVSISAYATRDTGRGIRRNNDGTFPAISKPMTAQTGVNGNPIQSQISTNSINMASSLSANHLRAGSKSKVKAEKLSISNPILNDGENTQNSLKKIPMVDLVEAARNERLRRETFGRRISTLVAQRPAPRPPSPRTAPDAATVEPQIPRDMQRFDSTKTYKTSAALSVEGNASSTGSLLSPSIDAVRRRSPRQPEPTALSTPFRVIRPGEPIRIPIPRPQEPEIESPPTTPLSVKTPLQRRATTGLPSNPRAQALKSLRNEANSQKTQTVMFVNNIVYNNPDTVGDIIQGVAKDPQPPHSGKSVVNRPRPIPRTGDKDRQVFPAEISTINQHRRTKSSGSVIARKSILRSVPGSPTGLPALPPIPSLDNIVNRPVPNNTKSMTVEEKMDLLYLAPLSAPPRSSFSSRRSSSVPNIPPVPLDYLNNPTAQPAGGFSDSESDSEGTISKAGEETTVRSSSVVEIIPDSHVINTSAQPSDISNKVGGSWLPEIQADTGVGMTREEKRRSSAVLPWGRQSVISAIQSEERFGDEEAGINWGSVHSPAVPVTRQNARSTYIKKAPRNSADFEDTSNSDTQSNSQSDSENSESHQNLSLQYHHRIGDDCPTFSARKDHPRPRKMPPPTPLLLNGRAAKRTIPIKVKAPSPIESPTAAYQILQDQLRKFDRLDEVVVESPRQRLADLEQEMGQLESQWQSNHDHLDRNSMSSIQTTPSRGSRPTSQVIALTAPSSQRSSIASIIAERRASRRAQRQNGGNEETTASSQNPDNTHSIVSRTEPTEEQTRYMENALRIPEKRNDINFLQVPKGGLRSVKPSKKYESHLEHESNPTDSTISLKTKQPIAPMRGLWSHGIQGQEATKSKLWSSEDKISRGKSQSYELPGLSIRSATRKNTSRLKIESSCLWQDRSIQTPVVPQGGLWNNRTSQRPMSLKAPARPVTMRPPRKNKRITLLPDIIENPEPLPHKRDTLGIFQFPWGEKSEHATVQYRQSQAYSAMPGTMTTGHLVFNPIANIAVPQPEESGYSSSFFDEYEDEEGDNFSDFSGSGDDEFDETTLWEIASLLQTDMIAPRDSILLTPSQSSPLGNASQTSEYAIDLPSDDERDDCYTNEILTSRGTLVTKGLEDPSHIAQPSLWAPRQAISDGFMQYGLPQNQSFGWRSHSADKIKAIRGRPSIGCPEFAQGTKLWSPIAKRTVNSASKPTLWTPSMDVSELQKASSIQLQMQTPKLWVSSGNPIGSATPLRSFLLGLPAPEPLVWQELIFPNRATTRSRSRSDSSSMSISSSTLWSQRKVVRSAALWSPPPSSPVLKTGGLFTRGASKVISRTTTNAPAALSLPRRISRCYNANLEPLVSTSLWTLHTPSYIRPKSVGLWEIKETSPVPTLKSSSILAKAVMPLSGLWIRPTQAQILTPSGLFNPKVARNDYRRTSQPLMARCPSTKPRVISEGLAILTSRHLWSQNTKKSLVKDSKPRFVISSGLWIRPIHVQESTSSGLFNPKAIRNDYRRTSQPLMARLPSAKPRMIREGLAVLTSRHLWSQKPVQIIIKTSKPGLLISCGLWIRPTSTQVSASSGLFNLKATRNDYRRTSQPLLARLTSTKPRIIVEDLAVLTSRCLWTKRPEQIALPSSGLWIKAAVPSSGLWSQPTQAQTAASLGLFNPRVARNSYRRTSQPLIVRITSTKPRTVREGLAILSSRSLWCQSQAHIVVKDSRFGSKPFNGLWTKAVIPSRGLWSRSTREQVAAFSGLFNPRAARSDYRKTLQPLMARLTSTKPRTVKEGLAILTSRSLWSQKQVQAVANDNKPASLWQRESKKLTTPTLFKFDAQRTQYRTTSASPAALVMAKRPRAIQERLQPIKSTHLWAGAKTLSMEMNWITAGTLVSRKPSASASPYNVNWDAALAEAVAASYPSATMLSLRASYPQDWDAQLQEAIMAGRAVVTVSRPICSRQRAATTAEDWSTALHEAVLESYPAKLQNPSHLWTQPLQSLSAPITSTLWTPHSDGASEKTTTLTASAVRSANSTTRYRSTSEVVSFGLQQRLWRRGSGGSGYLHRHPSSLRKNWLEDSMKRKFSRIELRY